MLPVLVPCWICLFNLINYCVCECMYFKWQNKKLNEKKQHIQLTTQTNSGDKLFHFGLYIESFSCTRAICLVCGQHERDMTKMEEQPKANCHRDVICHSVGDISSCSLVWIVRERQQACRSEHEQQRRQNRSEKDHFDINAFIKIQARGNVCIRVQIARLH